MEIQPEDHITGKKSVRPTVRPRTAAMFMLRCAELGLSISDLHYLSIGMVEDMITEKANDKEDYPYIATQEDIDRMLA